jgi:hypothetical protein
MTGEEEDSIEADTRVVEGDLRVEGDMAVEVDMEEVEEGDINNKGIMIDHWIEELLRKGDVNVRKNVLWVHRDHRKRRRRFM